MVGLREFATVRAVIDAELSVTRAARAVNASQPGVSRHVLDLEAALGVQIFDRRKGRLVGLTAAGEELMPVIDRLLGQFDDIRRIAARHASGEAGTLTIATSQTHARYVLPSITASFLRTYPQIKLTIKQGYLSEILSWLNRGDADICLCAAPSFASEDLMFLPHDQMNRVAVAPLGHPLTALEQPSLEEIGRWPIITYGREFFAHKQIITAFSERGIYPRIAMEASDTDVMKAHAASGLGIAILAEAAFDPALDGNLQVVGPRSLFPATLMHIIVHRHRELTRHALFLIELISPQAAASLRS